jgi:Carboxypeptidase regulatory-like domain
VPQKVVPEGEKQMRKALWWLFLAVLVSLFLSPRLDAQEFRATLSGVVRDPSGAAVAKAEVKAIKKDSGQSYSTITNEQGFYTIPYLIPGGYQVTAEALGFRKSVHANVPLTVAEHQELDFKLELGTAMQEVVVSAAPEVVNTADASGGTTIGLEQVQNLPLNGGQVYMLMELTPGVMFLQEQFGSSGYSGTRGWDANNNYSMCGGWQGYNQFLLNGSPVVTDEADGLAGGWFVSPNRDAVQEFKIVCPALDAEFGRTGGGIVNTTLKAGTNNFHGVLFENYVNSFFNANTFTNNLAGAPKGLTITNQFGGTFGGPILHSKAFFFGSLEGYRQIIPFPVVTSTLPSSVKILPSGAVDFSATGYQVYDPLTTHVCTAADNCVKGQTYARNPFPGDVIPGPNDPLPPGIQSRVNPIGLAIMKLYPAPTNSGLLSNYIQTGGLAQGRYRYYQPMVRVDYDLTNSTRLYGLWAWQRGHEHRNSSGFPYPIATGNIDSERDFITTILDVTHVFSPKWFLDVQGSFGRFHQDFPDGPMVAGLAKAITAESLGLHMPKIPTTSLAIAPQIQVSGYQTIIGNNISEQVTNAYDFRPVVMHVVGKHDMHFGGEIEDIQYADMGVGRPLGQFGFNTGFTQDDPFTRGHCPGCGTASGPTSDGFSFASLALGYPNSGNVDWNQTQFETWHYYATFFQDNFRVARKLTLNLGLRWDVQTSPSERYNRINAGFCWTCVNPITDNPAYKANLANAANVAAWKAAGVMPPSTLYGGLLFAGSATNSSAPLQVTGPRAPYDNYPYQFQPRLGIAYAVRPHTVIRAGYGQFYAIQNQHDTRTGFTQSTGYINSLDGALTPANSFASGTPYPNGVLQPTGASLGLLTNVGNSVGYDWHTRRIPLSQQVNFGIQQELPGRTLLEVSYGWNYTNRMTMSEQWDVISNAQQAACQANPNICNQLVPNPFYGVVPKNTTLGSSPKIQAWNLMRGPFPEFNGVTEFTNPGASSRWDALLVKVERRVGDSLTFLSAFTYQKQIERNHWLNNGQFRDVDPIREIAYFDRTLVWRFSGVWDMPFKTNGAFGQAVNGWGLHWIFSEGSGRPMSVPDAYFTCQSISVPHQSFGQWFNNNPACWQARPQWSRRVMSDRVGWIRTHYVPQLSMAVQKDFHLKERFKLRFRTEAFNLTNTPIFPGPSTDIFTPPHELSNGSWIGLGTVRYDQQNFPRNIQFSLKLLF